MRITNITAIPIKLQMKQPFVIANVTNYDMYYVIVKIKTDSGIIGFGEATPAWEVTGETYQSVIGCVSLLCNELLLGVSLIGQEITTLDQVESVISLLYPQNTPQLIYGNPSAKAAIEQAILDAYGKYVNKPTYKIFGGTNRGIPFTKNISIHPVEKTLSEVKSGIADGFSIIRLKIGIQNYSGMLGYQRDVDVIQQAARLIKNSGRKIRLVADANQGFTDAGSVIEFCREIDGCLDWLEQPLFASNLEGFLDLKGQISTPLMADESLISPQAARYLISNNAVDYINIKLMKTGGFFQARKLIAFAEEYGIKCHIGSMLETMVGASMGCHLFLSEKNIISTDLNSYTLLKNQITNGLRIQNNQIYLSHVPGAGIKIQENLLSKFAIATTYEMG